LFHLSQTPFKLKRFQFGSGRSLAFVTYRFLRKPLFSQLQSPSRRCLAVFKLLEKRDRELADAFDNPRRSAALAQLAQIRSRGLITDEEFGQFRPETREAVGVWLGE
jgi:hypothetical protein